jgi:hypothetical protein
VLKLKRPLRHLPILTLALGVLIALPDTSAAAPKKDQSSDICVVERADDGLVIRTLVFSEVPPLSPGQVISLRGVYFTLARVALPFEGSAVMAADGTVRLGVFIHFSARRSAISAWDFLLSGETDQTFAGVFHFKYDGDLYPTALITLEPEDCAAIIIP